MNVNQFMCSYENIWRFAGLHPHASSIKDNVYILKARNLQWSNVSIATGNLIF